MSDELTPGDAETALPTESDIPGDAQGAPETDQIGPYRIISSLGEGGMGTVYLAEQEEPVRREVALKVIKLGMDTAQVVARFDAERQALAIMTHPNVAKVLDAGVTADGRPYFAMEYVAGIPITEYCDRHQLTVRDRLELFIKACQGIQHAHQKGIVHRDVKPSNILVSEHDGEPVPSVIDFGIAKATEVDVSENTALTQHGAILGTPLYMSPEQAGISGLDVDTTADIYSLGVLLYELVVGALPFEADTLGSATWDEKIRILWQDEAPRPSARLSDLGEAADTAAMRRQTDVGALHRRLRGDLDWVVMKAIEKDRTRRYESAAEFAADIQRHLDHEPVEASPPSAAYRARKFVRRNRVGVAASVAVLLALVGGLAASTVLYIRSERERAIADASVDFLTEDLLGAVSPWAQGRDVTMLEVLDAAATEIDGKFPDLPLVEASIRQTLGQTYTQLADNDSAETHLRVAVELRRQELGEDHPDTLTAAHYLGATLLAGSNFAEAREIFEEVLEARQRDLGPDHIETLRTKFELGAVVTRQGDEPEGRRIHEENLTVLTRTVGNGHPLTLVTKLSLGSIMRRAGDLEGALAIDQEILEGSSEALGAEHPDTLGAFNNLAIAIDNGGEPAVAVAMFRENLDVQKRVMGPYHLQTLRTMNNIALSLKHILDLARQDRIRGPEDEPSFKLATLSEARALEEESLRIAQLEHGLDHVQALAAMNNLFRTLSMMGDFEGARTMIVDLLERSKRVYGEESPQALGSMTNLAALLRNQFNDPEGARPLDQQVYDVRLRVLGPEHRETLRVMSNLAFDLERVEDWEAAEELGQLSFTKHHEVFGLEDPRTSLANRLLVNALYRLDRRDDAIAASQTLCWLLEADEASLVVNQPRIRDRTAADGACSQ